MSEGSLDTLTEYLDNKREALSGDVDSLTTLAKNSPSSSISDFLNSSASDSAWNKIKDGPLGQMGKDFVAEMIAKNGATIINNIDTAIQKKIKKPLEEIQSAVFDTMTAALTAKNDLAMYFIQQVAKELLVAIDKKTAATTQLREKIRELYNILILLTTTKPFFDTYLKNLRQGLIIIYSARNNLVLVRNTLLTQNRWLKNQFKQVQSDLLAAEALITPAPVANVGPKFTDKGLLAGVGIPKKPQQMMLILSVPQKIKEVLACANGYFFLTLKLNVLLLSFCAAYGSFTAASSRKLTQFTINTLDNITAKLDSLISRMATQLNGSANAILTPDTVFIGSPNPALAAAIQNGGNIGQTDPGTLQMQMTSTPFTPDPVSTSANAMTWIFELKTTLEYLTFVPGPTLSALNVSNTALSLYEEAVKFIQAQGSITDGDAILTATQGREETGQVEKQVATYLLVSAKAIYDPVAGKQVLPLGRTILKRLDMSLSRDAQIRQAVAKFAGAQLSFPSAIGKAGASISKMLRRFGLDRAADALKTGDFAKLFGMNGKTCTYVGAAIATISVLKECLTTEEEREQLTQAQRVLEQDQKSQELMAQRASSNGFTQQIQLITIEEQKLDTLSERTKVAGSKCGLPNDLSPTNLMKNLGPIVGVSVLGNSTLQKGLTKLGKGII